MNKISFSVGSDAHWVWRWKTRKNSSLFIFTSSNFGKQQKTLQDDKFHILSCRALSTCIINYVSIPFFNQTKKKNAKVKSSEIYNSKAHRSWCGKCFACSSTSRVSNNLFYRCFYCLKDFYGTFVSSTFIRFISKPILLINISNKKKKNSTSKRIFQIIPTITFVFLPQTISRFIFQNRRKPSLTRLDLEILITITRERKTERG